jgi:transcription-repair coupling factor (superfamily II helicase)
VGRSHHRAYAYLLVPDRRSMTPDAEKRLDAIAAIDELGAGFALATHDLEIRGAGELLGDEQSGQIQEVGFSLYTELLERAVRALKEGRIPDVDLDERTHAEIELHVPSLIPQDYLGDVHSRLMLYKRIAGARNDDELRDLEIEIIDRFGVLPDPTRNLFTITALKLRAQALGIRKLELGAQGGRVIFRAKPNVDPMTVIKLVQSLPKVYALDGQDKLRIRLAIAGAPERIKTASDILTALAKPAK